MKSRSEILEEVADKAAKLEHYLGSNSGLTSDWPIRINSDDMECASELAKLLNELKERLDRLKASGDKVSEPCISYVSKDTPGRAFCVYLRDGKKITVGRTIDTRGPAWLEITEQGTINPMG